MRSGRATGPWRRRVHAHERARCAAPVAIVGVAIAAIAPSPDLLPVRQLGANAAVHTYWTWLTAPEPGAGGADHIAFQGYRPPYLVHASELTALAQRERPNVFIVVLESTRWDHTSLPRGRPAGAAPTRPTSVASRRAGPRRAALTRCCRTRPRRCSRSCAGRYPTIQHDILEYSYNVPLQCAPRVAAAAGYRTAYLQSSWGVFEQRPRLVDKLGFEHFEAWEDIQGESLGYLASDDESLTAPLERWLDAGDAAQPSSSRC